MGAGRLPFWVDLIFESAFQKKGGPDGQVYYSAEVQDHESQAEVQFRWSPIGGSAACRFGFKLI